MQWVPMDDIGAEEYIGWVYEPPYDFYNIPEDRAAAVLLDIFGDNGRDYFMALDHTGTTVGIAEFWCEEGHLMLGLGLRPDLTGQGRGRDFVTGCIDFGRRHYGYRGAIRLTVAIFNERAAHIYRQLGFRDIGVTAAASLGRPMLFLVMEGPPAQ